MSTALRGQVSVLVFCGFPPTDETGVHRFSKEMITGLDSTTISHYSVFWKKDHGSLRGLLYLVIKYLKVINKVNVIHFVVMTPIEIPFIVMSRLLGKKIITTYHGNYKMQKSITNKFLLSLLFSCGDKIFRRLSNVIVSPSKYLFDQLKFKENTDYIISNPYNFSISDFSQIPSLIKVSSMKITTASNFNIKEKAENLSILFEVFTEIVKVHKDIKLFVFGDGIYIDTFRTKYGTNENIVFMGFRKDFRNFLSHSDVYIHISNFDNQPYAIIDALFQGNVIVCNDLEGLVEMIPPENNFVVALEYSAIKEGLLGAIKEYDGNISQFRERGVSNSYYAKRRYGAAHIIQQYIQIYTKLINQ